MINLETKLELVMDLQNSFSDTNIRLLFKTNENLILWFYFIILQIGTLCLWIFVTRRSTKSSANIFNGNSMGKEHNTRWTTWILTFVVVVSIFFYSINILTVTLSISRNLFSLQDLSEFLNKPTALWIDYNKLAIRKNTDHLSTSIMKLKQE